MREARNANRSRLVRELEADNLTITTMVLELSELALVRTPAANSPSVLVWVDALNRPVHSRRVSIHLGHNTSASSPRIRVPFSGRGMPAAVSSSTEATHRFGLIHGRGAAHDCVRSGVFVHLVLHAWLCIAVHSSVDTNRISNLGLRWGDDVQVEDDEDTLVEKAITNEIVEADKAEEGDLAVVDEGIELGGKHSLLEVDAIGDGETVARRCIGVGAGLRDALELADLNNGTS